MNKSLLKRIASVATELDMKGFTKEAKTVDLMLLKLAQEEYENVYQGYFDNKDFGKEEIGMGDAEVKPQENTLSDNSKSDKFKVYQAIDLTLYPYEYQIVLLSARNEDEAYKIIKTYSADGEWEIKEIPMMAPQNAGPGVLWDNYEDAH